MQHEPDAADRFLADRDRKECLGRAAAHRANELARVALRVRMRKGVAQVDPDLAVVGVTGERLDVRGLPRPHDARFQRELHRFSTRPTRWTCPPRLTCPTYSARNVTIGSTRSARRTGRIEAAAAVSRKIRTTTTYTRGSNGETS